MDRKGEKRMVWGESETLYFLQLLKEKQLSVSKPGKKIRIAEIFGSLEKPMRNMGYNKTAFQMCIKFKNLKAKYYPSKRLNLMNKNELITCEFYEEMDHILADRISLQMGDQSKFSGECDPVYINQKFSFETQPKIEINEDFENWTELEPNDESESNDTIIMTSTPQQRNVFEHFNNNKTDNNQVTMQILNDPLRDAYSENQDKQKELHEIRMNILRLEEKIKLKTLMHMDIEHSKRVRLLDLQIKSKQQNKLD